MRGTDLDAFRGWLQRYFDAWASNDPVEGSALFAEDAGVFLGPFRGRSAGAARRRARRGGGGPRRRALAGLLPGRRRLDGGGGWDLGLRLRRGRPVRPAPGVGRPARRHPPRGPDITP